MKTAALDRVAHDSRHFPSLGLVGVAEGLGGLLAPAGQFEVHESWLDSRRRGARLEGLEAGLEVLGTFIRVERGHHRGEDPVDHVDDARLAAEIADEGDGLSRRDAGLRGLGIARRGAASGRELTGESPENGDVGAAEQVDGLLLVAYEEELVLGQAEGLATRSLDSLGFARLS